jgi:hypothetical protein
MATITVARSFVTITKKSTKTPKQTPKIAKFAENVGGRLAMQGLTWGGATRFMMNEHFQDQIKDPHNLMTAAAVTSLVCVASTITAKETDDESYFAWTPEAETLNGRVAMMGILAAFVLNV